MKQEEKKNNLYRVNFNILKKLPSWFVRSFSWPTYYYMECLNDFEIIEDRERFVEGYSFICKNCGKPCYCRMDGAERHRAFLVVTIICRIGCGKTWKLDQIQPLWELTFEDWETDVENKNIDTHNTKPKN
ncbi:MAG: hypothetical protein BWY04_01070 [candidate division CPR1 bacterium ADurb.Bin160]|uniref:Uncharacterized protein n=1 Tax=candidate division CPR1 bacterium ADurb.Bin160 TaxID=1852826 RepID=A0A1V5ZLC5_9BACT|nr:MAG: hypothetical protein BWY04_01070 [candidate division CPR1 bacterium ADurb.Bin160]